MEQVGRMVERVGDCHVMAAGGRYYVLDGMAREVGDCADIDAARGVAQLVGGEWPKK